MHSSTSAARMVRVSDLFEVRYGVNLELNKMVEEPDGINFVSRTEKNNGVSARVRPIDGLEPIPAGTISVAGGGSVMASFLQAKPYYSGRDLYYLQPKQNLTINEMLFYCACLRANRYRYNYGRQANRTLGDLRIPAPDEFPSWVDDLESIRFANAEAPAVTTLTLPLETSSWAWFELQDLFELRKGKRLTKAMMTPGTTPFIGAIDSNNGYRQFVNAPPIHEGGTITINYNGSVAEAFYQPRAFWASDDVNVLYPKFEMSQYVGLFICTVIMREKYRFNYGRKWHLDRMKRAAIRLPVDDEGSLNLEYMERFIKSLSFSSSF